MDRVLAEAERYLLNEDYHQAVDSIRSAAPTENKEWQQERRRFLAWATLSTGETREAYELFWSCAQHEGARAGILLLTVLAGQMETAMENWMRYCEKLQEPPEQLPDGRWHTPLLVKSALRILQNYPFDDRTSKFGAASVYQALLHQTQGHAPESFRALAQVTHFFPPARLLRDRWMDGLLCLPLPKREREQDSSPSGESPGSSSRLFQTSSSEVVQKAAQILLYPDLEILQKQCRIALQDGRLLDALEALRRLLFLDPQHTPSLEQRWRLYLKLQDYESAKQDLFYLMDLYEREKEILKCKNIADQTVELFPSDERALLKMCFLQARLGATTELGRFGRKLLDLCGELGLADRRHSYRRWLLRQKLSLDDRTDFEAS